MGAYLNFKNIYIILYVIAMPAFDQSILFVLFGMPFYNTKVKRLELKEMRFYYRTTIEIKIFLHC